MGLFGVSKAEYNRLLKELESAREILFDNRGQDAKIVIKNLKDECALLLIELNNISFDADPDIRERVRNLTMIASRAIEVLHATKMNRELTRLKEYYIKSIVDVIRFSGKDIGKKSTIIDAINSTENLLFEYINGYKEFKQIDAIAGLTAAQSDMRGRSGETLVGTELMKSLYNR